MEMERKRDYNNTQIIINGGRSMERINPNDYEVGAVVGNTKNGNDIRVLLFNGKKVVCTDPMLGKLKAHAANGRVYAGSGEFDDVCSKISLFEDQKKAENARDNELLKVANEVHHETARKKGKHQKRVTNVSDNVVMDWDEIVRRCTSLLFTVNDLSEWVNDTGNRSYLTDRHRDGDVILRETAEKITVRLRCGMSDITRKTPAPEPEKEPEQMVMDLEEEKPDDFDLPYVEGIIHFPVDVDRRMFESIIRSAGITENDALTIAFVWWFAEMKEKSVSELATMFD